MPVVTIQLQKLFLVALVLKVSSAFVGWLFELTWTLGFTFPLAVMVAYIALGHYRRDDDVSDEKFADSCYYLGFIFTITSIIFSLLDLPSIGTRIQDIAVRFGAAMVSTVLGLGVRVYLVSFKQDIDDAIQNAEDAVIDATRKFTVQLTIALEKLRDFEVRVDTAAKESVERVNLQVENLSKNHADRLADFFADLTSRNQEAFSNALAEVRVATERLSESVDNYSSGMKGNLSSIEAKVAAFAEAVTDRLKTTSFPDDYFARQLEVPLGQLKASASALAVDVSTASLEVGQSTTVLTSALKKLRDKANAVETAMESVLKLGEQQEAVLHSSKAQVDAVSELVGTMQHLDTALSGIVAGIGDSQRSSSELLSKISSVIDDGAETRRTVENSLATVAEKLDRGALANSAVAEKLDHGAKSTDTIVSYLSTSVASSDRLLRRLDGVVTADAEAAASLATLAQHATTAISKVDSAVLELQAMVRQMSALDEALRSQGYDLKSVAEQIKDVKVVVELPRHPHFPMSSLTSDVSAVRVSGDATLGQGSTSTSAGA